MRANFPSPCTTARRREGNLSLEESRFVCRGSWFLLALEMNTPIVQDLRAEAPSPEQRLFSIAQRVGLPAHGRSKSFFDIAEPLSALLIQIEMGTYNNTTAVGALYNPKTAPATVEAMRTIIDGWSTASKTDLKSAKVVTSAR